MFQKCFTGALLTFQLVSCVSVPPNNFANNSQNQTIPQAPNPSLAPDSNLNPSPTFGGNIESDTILYVNRFRATQGLPPVQLHPGLANLAQGHSQSMRQRNTMDHFDFSGRAKVSQQNYQMGSMAENVQRSWGTTPTAEAIVRQWESSPKHRANMKGNFNFAGMGVSQDNNSIFSTLILGQGVGSGASAGPPAPFLVF